MNEFILAALRDQLLNAHNRYITLQPDSREQTEQNETVQMLRIALKSIDMLTKRGVRLTDD